MFPQKFCGIQVRNFQIKILFFLRASYVHVFDSLYLNTRYNIRVSEGYFGAKYKQFPKGITYANISAFFRLMPGLVFVTNFVSKENFFHPVLKFAKFLSKTDSVIRENCFLQIVKCLQLCLIFMKMSEITKKHLKTYLKETQTFKAY